MADTFTTNYNLTKPEVGASTDTWGTKLNLNLDAIDQTLKSISDAAAGVRTIAQGGTGATTAAGARTNLGVPATDGNGASGTWGISITGSAASATVAGNITGTAAIGNGGTGATTAAAARVNLGVAADAAANGIMIRTAAGERTARALAAGAGISISNADGVAGNPTVTNSGVTSIAAGTGITISGSTGGVTISASGLGASQVPTAYGNNVTYSGVGAYVWGFIANVAQFSAGATFSAGGGNGQVQGWDVFQQSPVNNLSGTWRALNNNLGYGGISGPVMLFVRIS